MRALVFAPHAGIWVHAFPEALVADALRTQGAEIVYVTCGGALGSYCVTMAARGLTSDSAPAKKDEVCRGCRANRDFIRRGFELTSYDFESVLTDADLAEIEQIVDRVQPDTVAAFVVDGVNVGRAALYEYMIRHKKSRLEVSAEEWPRFRPQLVNAMRSLVAADQILERERPDRVFVYNSLYSVNAMWRAAATSRGIPAYFLHAGIGLKDRLQSMIVATDSPLVWAHRLIAAWPQYRDLPVSDRELEPVTAHFEQLFAGTSMFAYSAAKAETSQNVRTRFGVGADQKLLVASMSSYDEYIAAVAIGEMPEQNTSLFPTQIEWVRALVPWMRTRPDLFLIIRVHPREFPNKREGTKSEHATQLEVAFADLPPNVRVNWPSDKLSIYDLAEHADVFLNAWSSAGREMALLGLPVVVYGPELLLYPADLNYVGTTLAAYFGAIDTALRDGWDFERVRRTYRWCVLEMQRAVADIADGFAFSEEPPRNPVDRAWRAALALPGMQQRWDLFWRPNQLTSARRIAEAVELGATTLLPAHAYSDALLEDETAALRAHVRRLATALAPGALRTRLLTCVANPDRVG